MPAGDIKAKSPYKTPEKVLHAEDFVSFCNSRLGVIPARVDRDLHSWLEEDHGGGDCTLLAALESNPMAEMVIVAKEDFVLCGLPFMAQAFRIALSSQVELRSDFKDGDKIVKGSVVLWAQGKAAGLLLGERVALNLCSRLSGVATKTAHIQAQLNLYRKTDKPVLLETRKTTPGLRMYEKYATRVGGARNHRHGLDGGSMLKENHLRAIGNIAVALESLKKNLPILSKIEIEVTNLDEFRSALEKGADVIMLDNFTDEDVFVAVRERNNKYPNIALELSGNLDLKNVEKLVASGVDFASMGALVHKAVWVDMSMQLFV